MTRNRAISAALVAVSLVFLFWEVLAKLIFDWSHDENYSHGFLVVPFAAYVAWRQREQLARIPLRPSLAGLAVVLGSVAVLGAGTLGIELFLTRLALLGVLAGTVAFLWGFGHLRALGFAFLLLFLAIPIPAIIFNQIAFPLQLLASRFGEFAISACQIPVLRQGNVIVLASTSLEVAEACSGIRSLVSLVALAAIWGYLSQSPTWLRWLLVLAAAPIAIFANGIRVAGTGIAAHLIGPGAAEGFFHTFSGWLVFVVAAALLLVVHRGALWLVPSAAAPRKEGPAGPDGVPSVVPAGWQRREIVRAGVVACCLVCSSLGLRALTRTEATSLGEPLAGLPMQVGPWSGREGDRFSPEVEAVLRVTEYVTRDYSAPGRPGLSLYVGYYASQRQGQTMHSPMNCMPGSGWEPMGRGLVRIQVEGATGDAAHVEVNRMIVQRGIDKLLVLYRYQGHGRVVASDYWQKVYTVVDAIRLNRSDGSMVRIMVPIDSRFPGSEREAESAALDFAGRLVPVIDRHLPG